MEKKNYGKLISEIGIAVFVLFLITILLNGYAIYRVVSNRVIARFQSKAVDVISSESQELAPGREDYPRLVTGECVIYWCDHPEEVKQKIRDAGTYNTLYQEVLDISKHHPDVFGDGVNEDDFLTLDPDERLAYAAYEYALESIDYNSWYYDDDNKVDMSIESFLLNDDGTVFMLFATDKDYRNVSEEGDFSLSFNMALGDTKKFDIDSHPMAEKAISTKQIQKDPEKVFSKEKGKANMNFFAPIVVNDKAVGLVRVTFEWTYTLKEIWKNVAEIEQINLIALLLTEVILLVIVYFAAVRPLKDIQENVRDYRENKDSVRIVENVKNMRYFNEFGMLASDVSQLAEELDRYINEVSVLSRENEKKNTELAIAKQIQLQNLPNVFPAFPDRKDLDIFASMDSAQEVGGDFYDFFFCDKDHLVLVIADVSGKGVPAALFMMTAKACIKNAVTVGRMLSPGEILSQVNDEICEGNDSLMFVTIWLGILDISKNILVSADAGHEKPVICRKDGEFILQEDKGGFVMGLNPGTEYGETEFEFNKGDTIFVYTDGVTEAVSINDEYYGKDRMIKALNRHRDEPVKDIISGMRADITEFVGGRDRSDDITMLAVKLL